MAADAKLRDDEVLQFVFAPHIEFGVNAAQGSVLNVSRTGTLNAEGSITRTSLGAFANVSNGDPKHPFIIGVGSLMSALLPLTL